jgi:hypothetical protein
MLELLNVIAAGTYSDHSSLKGITLLAVHFFVSRVTRFFAFNLSIQIYKYFNYIVYSKSVIYLNIIVIKS